MRKKLLVKIDRVLCIGAATCVALEPKIFQLDEEAKAVLLDPKDRKKTYFEYVYEIEDKSQEESLLMAAKSCPVNAVIVIDQESGKQVYP